MPRKNKSAGEAGTSNGRKVKIIDGKNVAHPAIPCKDDGDNAPGYRQ